MALRFLTDADIGDAELFIEMDLDGLQTLLAMGTTALAARLEQLKLGAGGGEPAKDALNAFPRVTMIFLEPTQDEPGHAAPV